MDRAYEGDRMRGKAAGMGFVAVVPPKRNRREPWAYDKERYKKRNEIERFFSTVETVPQNFYQI